jgi:hypothetical protein
VSESSKEGYSSVRAGLPVVIVVVLVIMMIIFVKKFRYAHASVT